MPYQSLSTVSFRRKRAFILSLPEYTYQRYNIACEPRVFLGKAPALVGSSKKDLLAFPEGVIDDIGYALGVVQLGGTPPSAKSWKVEGPGVLEIVEGFRGDAYRVVYTVRFKEAVYVLHCFQKKSPSGISTAKRDTRLIHERLKAAQVDYEVRYGKKA